jgi:hypothetical protein
MDGDFLEPAAFRLRREARGQFEKGLSVNWVESDVRYPIRSNSPFGEVTFTLTRVPRGNARSAGVQPLSQPAAAVSATYVTDITHYLDETGELMQLPGPARKLASFLSLLIEAATGAPSSGEHDSGIRCRTKACRGTIRTSLLPGRDEISWDCQVCGHNGVIRNWNNTKWNQLKRVEEPEQPVPICGVAYSSPTIEFSGIGPELLKTWISKCVGIVLTRSGSRNRRGEQSECQNAHNRFHGGRPPCRENVVSVHCP